MRLRLLQFLTFRRLQNKQLRRVLLCRCKGSISRTRLQHLSLRYRSVTSRAIQPRLKLKTFPLPLKRIYAIHYAVQIRYIKAYLCFWKLVGLLQTCGLILLLCWLIYHSHL